MELRATAIICAVRMHGEAGSIVRALTQEQGLMAGYVRGGRSRANRPVFQPGNRVRGVWRARTSDQLPSLVAELEHSVAPIFGEPLAASGIEWATVLTASALPEAMPYPPLFHALTAVIEAIEAAPSARGWSVALARYEQLLLSALGYGGMVGGQGLDWSDTLAALRASGSGLERHIFEGRKAALMETRARLVERLERAVV